ncbi:Gfo/Idh/MocA family protein [Labilibacter marinus]|uniref:Gfo/Idh/MocA family protein n=1 Tax=Labilibacter marinus TaxID=1477105 RepID=UPI0013013E75|nr:Gfo/Idh/MocA family oxidoreductase [Labilibacter marinus]
MNRRNFIKNASIASVGAATFPTIITSCVKGANDKVNIGMIGTGDHGIMRNLKNYLKIDNCRVVAICDVDKTRMNKAKGIINNHYQSDDVRLYDDFRELLLQKDIDAVQISTPDHWHVHMAIAAMQAGKHVCSEKPTLTIQQGRILVDQIKKHNLIFQTSLEDRYLEPYYRMAKLVREGHIGTLKKMRVGLPGQYKIRYDANTETAPIPDYFNYDMWLGPAPDAPYSPGRCHWNFRWINDYSGGNLTDWGAHLIDTAQLCNNAEIWGPTEVEGVGKRPDSGIYNAFYEYDLKYKYANGVEMDIHSKGVEIYCEGSNGWLHSKGWNKKLQASSEDLLHIKPGEEIRAVRELNEHVDFVNCVKNGGKPKHAAEDMHRTATVSHMGNIAMNLERKLQWDPAKEMFIGDDEANAMRSRPERAPWTLDKLMNG